jgi:hypothetical protein
MLKIEIAKTKNQNRKISKLDHEISQLNRDRLFLSKDCKLPMILFVGRILCKRSQAKTSPSGNSYVLCLQPMRSRSCAVRHIAMEVSLFPLICVYLVSLDIGTVAAP